MISFLLLNSIDRAKEECQKTNNICYEMATAEQTLRKGRTQAAIYATYIILRGFDTITFNP